jgi:predicted RNA binding protein YcfA (HicA-like mRNA interferase family)
MKRIVPTDWQTQAKIFEMYGCIFKRQKSSHMIYRCSGAKRAVVIPRYKEIGVSIIKSNMKTVGMTKEEYFGLLARL